LENAKEAMDLAEKWLGIPQVSDYRKRVLNIDLILAYSTT
jgi:hypothetical protein